jgi:hypothetical protein
MMQGNMVTVTGVVFRFDLSFCRDLDSWLPLLPFELDPNP